MEKLNKIITADEYAAANPEINDVNVFSVSTLAWDWRRQVAYKCMKGNHMRDETNMDMFRGKAVHEFIQRRLVVEGWAAEMKLSEYIDDAYVAGKRVRLIGHVDLYEPKEGVIVELKSSQWSDRIVDSYVIQAGAYAAMLRNMKLKVNLVYVVKINSKITTKVLFEEEIIHAYETIKERARLAANEIEKCLNMNPIDSYRNE